MRERAMSTSASTRRAQADAMRPQYGLPVSPVPARACSSAWTSARSPVAIDCRQREAINPRSSAWSGHRVGRPLAVWRVRERPGSSRPPECPPARPIVKQISAVCSATNPPRSEMTGSRRVRDPTG
jgi:hypothetical protein